MNEKHICTEIKHMVQSDGWNFAMDKLEKIIAENSNLMTVDPQDYEINKGSIALLKEWLADVVGEIEYEDYYKDDDFDLFRYKEK